MKKLILLCGVMVMAFTMSITAFAAEGWKQDSTGWKYENADGSYAKNGWKWIDNRCYYFNTNGYILTSTTTPDGYDVNSSGVWWTGGIVEKMRPNQSARLTSGVWKQDSTGWWYDNGDGTWPADCWKWIDGNRDGTFEAYHFNANGYMTAGTNTDDCYVVNKNGAWTVNGVVQTTGVNQNVGNNTNSTVKDGNTVAKITMNDELIGYMRTADGISKFPGGLGSIIGTSGVNLDVYNVIYKNSALSVRVHREINQITGYLGSAKALLNNIPEQGISLNAFYENTGFECANGSNRTIASTGRSDSIFGLGTRTYRMTECYYGDYVIAIVLTKGSDGQWYVFPNNQTHMN